MLNAALNITMNYNASLIPHSNYMQWENAATSTHGHLEPFFLPETNITREPAKQISFAPVMTMRRLKPSHAERGLYVMKRPIQP
jgi:hypothetical protein